MLVRKETEEIDDAHIFGLMHKLISSCKDCDDLSIGFHQDISAHEREMCKNKTTQGILPGLFFLKRCFRFGGCQESVTYGLGYNLALL